MNRLRPTLVQLFVAANIGLLVVLGVLFRRLYETSRQEIVDAAHAKLTTVRDRAADEVGAYLSRARAVTEDVERDLQHGVVDSRTPAAVEVELYAALLRNPDVAEVTFTHAASLGWNGEGDMRSEPGSRWQVSVFRESTDPGSPILARETRRREHGFSAETHAPRARLAVTAGSRVEPSTPDPTEHPTFATLTSQDNYGRAIWSDLSYCEVDARLPETERRVAVTVMKAVEDQPGRFAGVVRVGLRVDHLARIVQNIEQQAKAGGVPLQLYLADASGRLVTPLHLGDHPVVQADDELRFTTAPLPRELVLAMSQPGLRNVTVGKPSDDIFFDRGREHRVGFGVPPDSRGWRVVVLLATDDLRAIRDLSDNWNELLRYSLLLMALVVLGGAFALSIVQRGLGGIVQSTERMRRFDFAPSSARSSLRDVQAAIESLELAKTALRAMEKYVPTDLVRLLYQTGREPMLGGELATITMMFTDIEGFTTLSERLATNDLARVLGRYLDVMTRTIHGQQGTIDKYIGDAVMAVWNTPSPCADHVQKACQAALDCVRATEALFDSPEWAGTPRLVTRYGLHTDEVMVGHFGAPDRMSFTCLGDGVNLASRLEGLNKQYGTTILVSEKVCEQTRGAFAFRVLDIVAVKGKKHGVRVYELLGTPDFGGPRLEAARRYEQAFEAYLRRDFAGALSAVSAQEGEDPPSRALAARCRHFLDHPPSADWDGTWVATSK
jgi:adenylate cyclase